MEDEFKKNPEGAEAFTMESNTELFEEKEVDTELLSTGFQEEIEKARSKEQEGKEEHYGRTTFVAARSSELGITLEIDSELWKDMKEKGYDFKEQNKDAWGMTFMAGYLKEIDPDRFSELKESFEDAHELLVKEMKTRIDAARENPKRWKEFFAMAEHLTNLESEVMKLDEFQIDKDIEEGIKDCLGTKQDNPVDYLEIINAIETVSPGACDRIDLQHEEVKRMLAAAEEKADEAKEKRDAWMYSLIKRNIRKVKQNILS